jgi:excisionase family DNA binding protein
MNSVVQSEAYGVPEVATKLGISRSHVYDLIRTNELHSVKIGKNRRIPINAYEAFLESVNWNGNQTASS